jgi:hypothetical protein
VTALQVDNGAAGGLRAKFALLLSDDTIEGDVDDIGDG